MRRKPAVMLPSSRETLFFPDDSMEEGVLLGLLSEAYERHAHPFKYVLVTEKRRNGRLREWGYDAAYVFPLARVRYFELLRMWKRLPMNDGSRPYSPDAEAERNFWESEAIERRANFGPAIQQFMRVAADEIKTGRQQGAMYPLRSVL